MRAKLRPISRWVGWFAIVAASWSVRGDITWTGLVSSEWANRTNWNPQTVPSAGDTVIVKPGAVVVAGPGDRFGLLKWQGGWIGGLLTVAGGSTVEITSASVALFGTLDNAGTVRCGGAGSFALVQRQPRVNNLAGGTWLIETDQALTQVNAEAPLFINAGTVRKIGGLGAMPLEVPFRNSGSFVVESGAVNLESDFENQAGATLTGEFIGGYGTLRGTLADTFNWSSGVLYFDLTTTPACVMNLYSDAAKFIGGRLTNGGTIAWRGRGDLFLYRTQPRLVNLAGATLVIENDRVLDVHQAENPLVVNAGTVRKIGDVGETTLSVPFENAGRVVAETGWFRLTSEFVNQPGASFAAELIGGYGTLRGLLADELTWRSGPLTFDATNAPTATLNILGDQEKYLAGTLVNGGTIRWSGKGKLYLWRSQPRLDNLAGGTFRIENDSEILPHEAQDPLLSNAGSIRKIGDVGVTALRVPIENAGRFIAEKGVLQLNAEFVNHPGATFSADLVAEYGTLRGLLAGTLNWLSGPLTFDATNAPGATLNITTDADKYLAGTLNNGGTIRWRDQGGLLFWRKQPRLNNLLGGVFLVENDSDISPHDAEAPLFVNAGTFQKVGDVGYTTLTIPFENAGTVVVTQGEMYLTTTLINHPGAVLTGAFAGGGGTLRGTLAHTLDVYGTLFFDATNAPTALVNISGDANKYVLGEIYNWGTVNSRGRGDLYLATFKNLASGLFVAENSSTLASWSGASNPKFINDGVFAKIADGGRLLVTIPFENRNTIVVQRGNLFMNNVYTQSGGRLQVHLEDEFTYGSLSFGAAAPLSGLLAVTMNAGFLPRAGTTFPLITYPSKNGAFTGMELPTTLVWEPKYEATKFTLKVIGTAEVPETQLGSTRDSKAGSSADPVNTAIGNYTHSETDLAIAARGPALTFGRFYNSRSSFSGVLGRGWTHTYDIALLPTAEGIAVRWSDGRGERFTAIEGAGYRPSDPGVFDTLRREADDTWTLTRKDLSVFRFDALGRLTAVADRNGNALVCAYTPQGRLGTVTDPVGRRLTFAYANDRLARVEDPAGRSVGFAYALGRLDTATDVLGNTIRYAYDTNSYLASVTDQRGVTTVANTYDAQGRVTEQRDGRNQATQFLYDTPVVGDTTLINPLGFRTIHTHTNYLLTRIAYPNGATLEYTYDTQQNRTAIQDRNGNRVRFEYDLRGNVTRTIAPDGGITTVTYGYGRFPDLPARKTDAANRVTQWQYDARGNTVVERRAPGTALQSDTAWAYNEWGQVMAVTNELGQGTQLHYATDGARAGLLVAREDAEGNRTHFDYDALWRRTKVVDARAAGPADSTFATLFSYDVGDRLTAVAGPLTTRSYAYNTVGDRVFERDGNGNERTYEYDENRNLRFAREPLGRATEFRYDALSRRIATVDANGHETVFEYDAMDFLLQVTRRMYGDGADLVTRHTYDAHGNRLTTTDPSGRKTTFTYDAMHRRLTQRDDLDHVWRWDYDKLGRIARTVDATGQATQHAYDALGRLQSITTFDDLGLPQVMRYEYDRAGRLTKATDPAGRTVGKAYDRAGRLRSTTDGLGHAWRFTYDPAGNQTSITDANGQLTEMVYDTENRLGEIHYPDATQVAFAYDGNGNCLSLTDLTGTTTSDYDALDRLTATLDGFWQRVRYGYDPVGNRTSLTYPDDRAVTNVFDAADRLRAVIDWSGHTTAYEYDPAGRLLVMRYPNGLEQVRTYDAVGRLATLVYRSHGANLLSYAWTRDEQGQPLTQTEEGTLEPTLNLPAEVNYQHDGDNRLTTSTEGTYTYDANGNLTSRTVNGIATSFVYDHEDRLVRQTTGTRAVQHVYDGAGLRTARIENSVPTRYVLDRGRRMSHVLGETDRTGRLTAAYLHGPDLIGRLGADGSQRYYLTDAIGSVVALTDETGRVTDRYAYTPFGISAGQEGKTANPFRYVGGRGVMADQDGLYFMRARFYEPNAGVFLHRDPVAEEGGMAADSYVYPYACQNPVTYIDPQGLYFTSGWDYLHAGFDIGSGVLGLTGAAAAEVPFGIAGALSILKGGLTGERDVQERGVAAVLFGVDMFLKSAEQGGQGVVNLAIGLDPTQASSYRTQQRELLPRPSRDILQRQGYGDACRKLETVWAISGLWSSLEKVGPAMAEARTARLQADLLKETLRNAKRPVPADFGFSAWQDLQAQLAMQDFTSTALKKFLTIFGNSVVWPRNTSPSIAETDVAGISDSLKH